MTAQILIGLLAIIALILARMFTGKERRNRFHQAARKILGWRPRKCILTAAFIPQCEYQRYRRYKYSEGLDEFIRTHIESQNPNYFWRIHHLFGFKCHNGTIAFVLFREVK